MQTRSHSRSTRKYLVAIHDDVVSEFTKLPEIAEIDHIGMGGFLRLALVTDVPDDVRADFDDQNGGFVLVMPFAHADDAFYGHYITLWQNSNTFTVEYKMHAHKLDMEAAVYSEPDDADDEDDDELACFAVGRIPAFGDHQESPVAIESESESESGFPLGLVTALYAVA
jgi:hypothetical protein